MMYLISTNVADAAAKTKASLRDNTSVKEMQSRYF